MRLLRKPKLDLPWPELFKTSAKDRRPLIQFMVKALEDAGCKIIDASAPNVAPFRISFELPSGERMGIVTYAFLANSRLTKNRPHDEHRFQLKYGSKDGLFHELWQDPCALYTTLLVGIDPERQIFIGADPVLHSPTKLFISVEFKRHHVSEIENAGWHVWERERQTGKHEEPVEILVGGTRENFLRYILLEREALREDQGHRQLLAEQFHPDNINVPKTRSVVPTLAEVHALTTELDLSEAEILGLIKDAPRLKMAVRGWVAELHLERALQKVLGVRSAKRIEGDGDVDVLVTLQSGEEVRIQCKNVLRKQTADGKTRLDFQRTRTSKSNPCSRFYSSRDFDVVAACVHAVKERWEFEYVPASDLDPHKSCAGKLASNVKIDDRWTSDPAVVLGIVP
jgi:hypothetical protein